MKAPAEKSPDNQRQAVTQDASQQQDRSDAEFQFVDNRAETTSLRQLQETADNSPRTQGLSQLKTMMNSSPRSGAMQSLQAMVDNSPRRVSMGFQAGLGDVTVQRVEDEEVLQGEFDAETPAQLAQPAEAKPNNTGLPDNLKAGVESLSGLSLDNVKVHYNSSKPAQLNAHAYAQGTDIHLAPGQEQHLPHEAWHVVQQAQGRVKPTVQMKGGVEVNDDQGLEAEADLMGERAMSLGVVQGVMEKSTPIESDPIGFAIGFAGSVASDSQRVIQRTQILSNTYESSESPVTTVKNFVSEQTGESEADVLSSMSTALKKKHCIGDYLSELDSSEASIRPNSVKAYIGARTGSRDRPKLITALGKLGNFEDLLRRGVNDQNYDGGHLLALEFYNDWDRINTAYNVAPEEREENQHRGWRAMENFEDKNFPLLVTTYVNYPTDQYTVSLRTISDQMLSGAIKTKVDGYWLNSLKRVTVNTRLPSQFVTEYTKLDPREWGGMESGPAKKSLGYSPTTILPSRLPRMILAPVEDLLIRLLSEEQDVNERNSKSKQVVKTARSRGGKGMTGGALIVKNRSVYDLAGFRAAAENLARVTVYYYMWIHGMPIALATHAALSYFGSGAGESVIQSTASMLSGGRLTHPMSVLTSTVNSLIRYGGGDRLLSLGLNTVTALTTVAINPSAIPAMIRHRVTPYKE